MYKNSSIRILFWNANGLTQHYLELKQFLIDKQIDIALIAETHFTNKSHLVFPGYKMHVTNHPDGKGHGGSAIIIKTTIRHTERQQYATCQIQSTIVQVEDTYDNDKSI